MRLTLHTDLALRVMVYLAQYQDRLCSISEISRFYDVSHNHLVKVAHGLVRKGYIESARGRMGGLRLARAASEISVGEIVRSMEDCLDLVDCTTCRLAPGCGLRGLIGQAMAAFLQVLDECTIAQLQREATGILSILSTQQSPPTQTLQQR